MAKAQLTSAYEPLMDSYKVQLQRNGYSAACWVHTKGEIKGARERLQQAIERMEADQQRE